MPIDSKILYSDLNVEYSMQAGLTYQAYMGLKGEFLKPRGCRLIGVIFGNCHP